MCFLFFCLISSVITKQNISHTQMISLPNIIIFEQEFLREYMLRQRRRGGSSGSGAKVAVAAALAQWHSGRGIFSSALAQQCSGQRHNRAAAVAAAATAAAAAVSQRAAAQRRSVGAAAVAALAQPCI